MDGVVEDVTLAEDIPADIPSKDGEGIDTFLE